MLTERHFGDPAQAASDLARTIATLVNEAIAARGIATIALSGGRSPRAMLEVLRTEAIDWSKVVVTLVDERWVAPDHVDSNERLVRETLLQGPAATARFVPVKNDAKDPFFGQPACEAAMSALPWPFDMILLGMGEDGHTASLFPGAPELEDGLTTRSLTLAVTPPAAPHPRLSLSLCAILDSRRILLQIGGTAKEAVYRLALRGGALQDMPVRAVLLQDAVPVDVWISAT